MIITTVDSAHTWFFAHAQYVRNSAPLMMTSAIFRAHAQFGRAIAPHTRLSRTQLPRPNFSTSHFCLPPTTPRQQWILQHDARRDSAVDKETESSGSRIGVQLHRQRSNHQCSRVRHLTPVLYQQEMVPDHQHKDCLSPLVW